MRPTAFGRENAMFDDFFVRAMVAGIGVALTAGPLGCFVVWRRMAYFGDTMAHSALLGVALSLLLQLNLIVSVFLVASAVSILLIFLQRRQALSSDALLGILSHSALAIGLVIVAFMSWVRIDLVSFLFGDILAVTRSDIALIWGGGLVVIVSMVFLWRSLLASTVNTELAEAEGLNPERSKLIFTLLMALVIAIAMKVVGIMLITSLLIIPAATARRFSSTPEVMAVVASLIGAVAVVGGLFGSLTYDTPSGPSIVVAAVILFVISLLPAPGFPAPRMKEASHECADPAEPHQEPVAGDECPLKRASAAQRLYDPRQAARRWLPRAVTGLPGAGKAGGIRSRAPAGKPQRLCCLHTYAGRMLLATPWKRGFCHLQILRAGDGVSRP